MCQTQRMEPFWHHLLEGVPAQMVDVGPGDLHVLQAHMHGACVLWVCFDYATHQGSIGRLEAQQIVAALGQAQMRQACVVMVIESSGIRVTDSTAGIASFRQVMRAAADARMAGVRMASVVGRCAFGGASILACMGEQCVVLPHTVLAMSGPRLIAQNMAPGAFAADDAEVVAQHLGGRARARSHERFVLADSVHACRDTLRAWMSSAATLQPTPAQAAAICGETLPALEVIRCVWGGAVQEKELRCWSQHVCSVETPEAHICTLIAPDGARATDALALIQIVQQVSGAPLLIILDAPSHRAHLDDEQAAFSVVLADLVMVMRAAARAGVMIRLAVVGQCGGGILAALSAGAAKVLMAADAQLVVLPKQVMRALGKQEPEHAGTLAEALKVQAVDEMLRPGEIFAA